MSRLIDADELYNGSMKHEYFDFVEHDNHGRESYAYSCAMQRVAEAPTVEAIPVNWISAYINKAYGRVRSEIIREMLDAWMEQEAKQ